MERDTDEFVIINEEKGEPQKSDDFVNRFDREWEEMEAEKTKDIMMIKIYLLLFLGSALFFLWFFYRHY